MVCVKPFRGFLYNREKITNPSLVVAPPYDVITPEQQRRYYEQHPYNVIRIILGLEEPGDDDRSNKYYRAARYLSDWQETQILVRSPKPSFYFYQADYVLPSGESRQRKGFIGRMKLAPFSSGVIRPHEKTLSQPKVDRFNLLKTTRANFNPVFSLYSDPDLTVEGYLGQMAATPPALDISAEDGVRHRLWVVDDPDILRKVEDLLKQKKLIIADGHHRYETALSFRDYLRELYPDVPEGRALDYTMVYFSNSNDPGLTLLPSHRLVKEIGFDPQAFLARVQEHFQVEVFPFTFENEPRIRREVLTRLGKDAQTHYQFVLFPRERQAYWLFRLKNFDWPDQIMGSSLSLASRRLDASIMEKVIFHTVLGISCSEAKDEGKIAFVHTEEEAVRLVQSGAWEVAFLVNPTRIEEVEAIVSQGEIMPQKSTFFFPKLLSGLVINPIDPNETIS